MEENSELGTLNQQLAETVVNTTNRINELEAVLHRIGRMDPSEVKVQKEPAPREANPGSLHLEFLKTCVEKLNESNSKFSYLLTNLNRMV